MRRVCHGPFTWGRQQYIAISAIYIYHYIYTIYIIIYPYISIISLCVLSCHVLMYYDVTLHLYILVHLQREGEKKLFIYVAYISIYVISPDITGPLRQDIPQQKAVTSP